MKLNYKIQGNGQPIILLHGLFGNLDNLGVIARAFTETNQVIQIDLCNHGLSPWSDEMNYSLMANDVLELIDELALDQLIIVGHSMGGKVAMQLANQAQARIEHVIILDIAPVTYASNSHADVFKAINACHSLKQGQQDRKTIHHIMSNYLPEPTIQFLLKSYKSEHWLFNFRAIERHYVDIRSWQEISPYFNSVLFIKGGESDYINDEYQSDILTQFPYAIIETIEGAGHNVHTEKPQQVIALIKQHIS